MTATSTPRADSVCPKEEVYNIYLDSDDLAKIRKCNLEDKPGLVRTRDLFLDALLNGAEVWRHRSSK